MTTITLFLRSLVFTIFYIAWVLVSAIILAPFFIISTEASLKAGPIWANGVLLMARWICGIRYEIRGGEYLEEKPYIFASKHQSAWETAYFYVCFKRPAFILKRELLRIPLWGLYLWRMKMITIDRSAGASSIKDMIKQSKAALAAGRPIVIFPEGTRMPPGAPSHYHPGVVALYSQLKVPVVPVALNSGVFWAKNAFLKYPGTIIVQCFPPIPPGLGKEQFLEQLQTTIETASSAMLKETP